MLIHLQMLNSLTVNRQGQQIQPVHQWTCRTPSFLGFLFCQMTGKRNVEILEKVVPYSYCH